VKRKTFFEVAIKNLNTVGTFTYSSKYLIQQTLKPINFKKDLNIVELGAGNGCITQTLLNQMTANSRLFSFEINPNFVEIIKQTITDKRLELCMQSAELFPEVLQLNGIHQPDHIVSAVPMVVLPKALVHQILSTSAEKLPAGGFFSQITYSLFNKSLYKQYFKRVELKFTLRNFPPAFTYVCSN